MYCSHNSSSHPLCTPFRHYTALHKNSDWQQLSAVAQSCNSIMALGSRTILRSKLTASPHSQKCHTYPTLQLRRRPQPVSKCAAATSHYHQQQQQQQDARFDELAAWLQSRGGSVGSITAGDCQMGPVVVRGLVATQVHVVTPVPLPPLPPPPNNFDEATTHTTTTAATSSSSSSRGGFC